MLKKLITLMSVIILLAVPAGCGKEQAAIPPDAVTSIEIENMNAQNNNTVRLSLPPHWFAVRHIYKKSPDFEYSSPKNRHITTVFHYEIYNTEENERHCYFSQKGLAGEFYTQGFYRDQPGAAKFPNHTMVKQALYRGDTVLGDGEVYLLECDLFDNLKTGKFKTFDMVYAHVPIKGEQLAYNLSISVPPGDGYELYFDVAKHILGIEQGGR